MPVPALVAYGIPAAMTGAGMLGGLLQKKRSSVPDISGEMAKIDALFARMSELGTKNINREAGKGRGLAASNLASRGTYRSNVAENTFNALEGERLAALSNLEANLAGQQAETRSGLLRALLGMTADANARQDAQSAARWGTVGSLGSSLLLAQLLGGGGGDGSEYGALPGGGFGKRFAGAIGSGNTAKYGPSANFY